MDKSQDDRRGRLSRQLVTYLAHERTKDRAKQAREAQSAKEKLNQLRTDTLTGLPSNLALADLIENFKPSDYPSDTQIFCVYIDLKGIKNINDTQGHSTGDELIKSRAQEISNCFRTESGEDILFRPTGTFRQHATGDEFIVFLTCPKDNTENLYTLIDGRLSFINPNQEKFRFGISHSAVPKSEINNHIFFNSLIDNSDNNANKKRTTKNN